MSAQQELGPRLPSAGEIYRVANEVRALAMIAMECASPGRGCNLGRAQLQLERMRALLGDAGRG